MSEKLVKVINGDSKRRTVDVKNIEPINNIKIVRESEDMSFSDSESSDLSELSKYNEPKKKPKNKIKSSNLGNVNKPQRRDNPFTSSDYSAFSNPKKVSRVVDEDSGSEYSTIDESDDESGDYSSEASDEVNEKSNWEQKQKSKQDLLIKIQALEKKGFEFSKKFNMTSNFEEMMFEYEKVKHFIESQAAIRFSRRCLMACVTGLEFVNKKFDPFSVKLDGWSENVMENIDDYDNIFERLHEKYSGKAEISPEIELLLTLGGSAFMFHLTNSLLKSPVMNSINNQMNPNVLQSMMSAMSQGMREMNQQPMSNMSNMSNMNNMNQQSMSNMNLPFQVPQAPPKPVETRGIRKEMKGPSIDQSLFTGTPLMSNYPKPPAQPNNEFNYQNTQSFNPINEDDRFSIASSDSSLSEVSVKKISIQNGKKGKKSGGFELNIS
jgi:hypothetical protein